MVEASLKRRRDLALGSGAELFYDTPLEIVRGEGVYLYNRDGRRFVDMYMDTRRKLCTIATPEKVNIKKNYIKKSKH